MSDLTEQWKKGELSLDKSYYLRLQDGSEEIQMYVGGFLCNENNDVKEVLALVPSYEEWQEKLQALDAAHKAIKMEDETINRLVRSGKQCNCENTKLKELLKRCKRHINASFPEIYRELLQEINQALGEDK